MRIQVSVKKLREDARLPFSGSEHSAGYDLYACTGREMNVIAPHTSVMIGTGLACAIPEGYFGALFARSGLAAKEGLRPANCVGVLDSDYRGEYIVALHNDSGEPRTVEPGERIAQLVLLPCRTLEFELTDTLGDTPRGESGFGSTGK